MLSALNYGLISFIQTGPGNLILFRPNARAKDVLIDVVYGDKPKTFFQWRELVVVGGKFRCFWRIRRISRTFPQAFTIKFKLQDLQVILRGALPNITLKFSIP
jgi:hypothetical protein